MQKTVQNVIFVFRHKVMVILNPAECFVTLTNIARNNTFESITFKCPFNAPKNPLLISYHAGYVPLKVFIEAN